MGRDVRKLVLPLLVVFAIAMSGVSAIYQVRSNGTWGIEIDINGLPIVATNESTNVNDDSATLNGYLDFTDTMPIEVWFEYGETTSYGMSTVHVNLTTDYYNNYDEHIGIYIASLTPSTTYHFRFVGVNSIGRTNGSDKSFATTQSVYYNSTTSITSNSADANGYIDYGDGRTGDYGFWYDNNPVSVSNEGTNITVGSPTLDNFEFNKTITGLSSGEFYYISSWINPDAWFSYSSMYNESVFLTKPTEAGNFNIVPYATSIDLYWFPGSFSVTNYSTIVRYDTTGYPTSISGGIGGINSTDVFHKFSGMDSDKDYYFSLWTYINESGLHQYSSDYATISTQTLGGNYTFTVRYENITQGVINLTKGSNHKFVFHCTQSEFEINFFGNGTIDTANTTANVTSYTNLSNGTISVAIDGDLQYVDFYWNGSKISESTLLSETNWFTVDDYTTDESVSLTENPDSIVQIQVEQYSGGYTSWKTIPSDKYVITGSVIEINSSAFDNDSQSIQVDYYYYEVSPMRCKRTVISNSENDIDIYVLVDKKVYGESSTVFKDSLGIYEFTFLDETGSFIESYTNHPRVYFYNYNDTGVKNVFHSQYVTSNQKIQAWLLYEKPYLVAIESEATGYIEIGTFIPSNNLEPSLRIPYQDQQTYTFYDLIDLEIGWYDDGFYVLYQDTTYSTTEVTFRVFGHDNGTLIHEDALTNTNYNNFTFPCNTSLAYTWHINCTLDDINDLYDGEYFTGPPIFPVTDAITSVDDIDGIMEIIFGKSPIYNSDNGVEVPWTYIIVFIIAFILLTSVGRVNAFLGFLASGLVLCFAGGAITGLEVLYGNLSWAGPTTVVIGIFMVAVGFVIQLGGIEK